MDHNYLPFIQREILRTTGHQKIKRVNPDELYLNTLVVLVFDSGSQPLSSPLRTWCPAMSSLNGPSESEPPILVYYTILVSPQY